MRIVLTCLGLLLSAVSAQADKAVVSGKPLILYEGYSTNPDCNSAGNVVVRVVQAAGTRPGEHPSSRCFSEISGGQYQKRLQSTARARRAGDLCFATRISGT